tara:strand:+ start:158 stop:1315 length:1158 start_codon:yes stop_codon:yes gene_type:complete
MKKKICVVTGSRADYGLLYWVMKEIVKSPDLELIPIATGGHLSKKAGYTVNEIINDGFKKVITIDIMAENTSPVGIAKSMSKGVDRFAAFFNKNAVDFILLLGDRFEILAVALAALPHNIPIGHLGGGEISEGVIDDSIRHCLTKLSHLHFPITDECANRIKQMGEEDWRIKVVGSPRLDFIENVEFKSKEKISEELGIDFNGKVALVIYHPVTLEFKDTKIHIDNLLRALEIIDIETIILYPNIDTYSDIIINMIESYAESKSRIKLFKPLGLIGYLSLLNTVDLMIGNSSSAIVECPLFELPAVNIGTRQKGRDRIHNIIDVGYSTEEIVKGIRKGLYNEEFIGSLKGIKNPYGDGKASKKIVEILCNVDLDTFNIIKVNCFN